MKFTVSGPNGGFTITGIDRSIQAPMNAIKIALDVDGCLADFNLSIIKKAKALGIGHHFPSHPAFITDWHYSDHFNEVWDAVKNDREWWMSLKPYKGAAAAIDFPIAAYVTARPVPSIVTDTWLRANSFPGAPVHTLATAVGGKTQPKSMVMEYFGLQVLIDDKPENFDDVNNAGACGMTMRALLLDRPWNRLHEDGGWRIKSLSEVRKKCGLDPVVPTEPPPMTA